MNYISMFVGLQRLLDKFIDAKIDTSTSRVVMLTCQTSVDRSVCACARAPQNLHNSLCDKEVLGEKMMEMRQVMLKVSFFFCLSTDHKSGNTSLDTLLALLQTEGAKIEEETEVSSVSAPCWTVPSGRPRPPCLVCHLPQSLDADVSPSSH